jgi:hypothetical protein
LVVPRRGRVQRSDLVGVGWTRILFLIQVAIAVAYMVWGFMAAVTVKQVSGYLSVGMFWFYGREVF